MKKTVAIVGFGRFGKVLFRLIKDDFKVIIYNHKNEKDVYSSDVIFFAVPISAFESVIKSHKKYFKDNHILIDVLSVKMHPKKILEKYLRGLKTQALLTHPMFGPDSSKDGFDNLTMIMDKFKASQENYLFWKNFFAKKGLKIIEMSAHDHDKLAANSQGMTHFIARLLEKLNFKETVVDSMATKRLHELKELICHDSWQLFFDLQNYNPYTKQMRLNLGRAYDKLFNGLLPKRVNKKYLIFGIQGGKGSYNEIALMDYVKKHKITNYKVKYLYTTEKVLKNLHLGNVDYGLFAIHNTMGGIVDESKKAISRYKINIIEDFPINITHFLMKRKDISKEKINTIMSHPQKLYQCQNTLKKKYPNLNIISGKGDLVDDARAAKALVDNKISPEIAILGSKRIAEIYNLEIMDENLQDNNENYTSFFLVSR